METTIREATANDMHEVLSLIKELAEFEKAPDAVDITVDDLVKDGFNHNPNFKALVAETDGKVVGMALFFIGYSTWKGKMLFLDDLVVKKDWRKKGIGANLLDSVVAYAAEINAKVLKWQVLDWNKPAIDFYESYGVKFDGEWIDCKLYKDQIRQHQKKKAIS